MSDDDSWRIVRPDETDDQAWDRRHKHIEDEKRAKIAEKQKKNADEIKGPPDGVGI